MDFLRTCNLFVGGEKLMQVPIYLFLILCMMSLDHSLFRGQIYLLPSFHKAQVLRSSKGFLQSPKNTQNKHARHTTSWENAFLSTLHSSYTLSAQSTSTLEINFEPETSGRMYKVAKTKTHLVHTFVPKATQ
eukprot:2930700-Amphidinium_carterae.1